MILAARNLTVSATLDGESVPVIRDLSFALERGRVIGLVGESGAGKSMVGRTIAQLLPPGFAVTGGNLEFAGHDLVSMDAEERRALLGREIAFIPQEPLSALNPVLTIGSQFDEHLARIGAEPGDRRQRMLAALAAVHLPHGADLLTRYPHQLSGGMCQRVLIAFAFASKPKLVIADEPTTALDVTIQARIVRLIAEMQEREDTAVVFITHDLRLAAQVCDDILVLYAGRAAEYGPARKVFAGPGHPYTRCLQLANPAMSGARRSLYALPERMPGLRAYRDISGCAFAPRCPHVVADCTHAPPPLAEIGAAHLAACIRANETAQIAAPALAASDEPARTSPILEVWGLSKRFSASRGLFRRASEFTAVHDVSFVLHENEFVGIVGESGSGKSTLARLIVGLETPSEGRIAIAGHNAGDPDFDKHRRRHVQMVFQDPQAALNPRRRVASIVTQPLEAAGIATFEERLAKAGLLLSEIGLPPEAARRFPAQLSGGQRQRVNIARALCAVPRILIADEIVSGLDVSVQAQLLNLLAALRRERGFSMLFISHDLSVVRYLCDRVLVMYRGNVVESGTTEQVFSAPTHDYTRTLLAAVPPDDPVEVWEGIAQSSS
ncbi:MAG: dipeptide transport system ATP-binding protein dppF [Hyphomicrobiales bacterium]|jgi:peptide/nickel transport system ATP-binding protein